ncbi:hypothetical protein PMI29_04110 [Pseudomonas sp. GM49]|nr:hypothetical protein PMI29_04110 [Pseudomonas sp. GM49]
MRRLLLLLLLLLLLWRGGLSDRRTAPLRCEAALIPATGDCLVHRVFLFCDCFAAERGQAPSPQVMLWLGRGGRLKCLI